VVEKREALKVWTVLLAIGTFAFSLSGTFLVRSGILNSVHSFANDPARGVFILALLALVIGGALLLFAVRAPTIGTSGVFAPVSREGALVLNNILLCSIAAVVLTGTVYPLFADLLFGIRISVGPPFFNATVLPLAAPVFAAMTVGPALSWKRAAIGPALIRFWWVALVAGAVGMFAALGMAALPALAMAAAAWMILGAFAEIIERIRLFRAPLGNSLARLVGLPLSTFGTTFGHAGLGVTVAGIAGMSMAVQMVVLVRPGESVHLAGYDWTLEELHDAKGPNYDARVATIRVSQNGKPVVTLAPERRAFTTQTMTTTEAKIHTNGLRDLYAVLGDERDGAAVLRLHDNTMAPLIWLGALVMALGGFCSLADRRLRVAAPKRAPAAAMSRT
jgi:cytochrome c-type biogenesis protein CcmF